MEFGTHTHTLVYTDGSITQAFSLHRRIAINKIIISDGGYGYYTQYINSLALGLVSPLIIDNQMVQT